MTRAITYPVKTREIHNHHMDSTRWNDFPFRDDDVIIGTYAKSGTTWTQQIVGQLLLGGEAETAVGDLSPWVDMRIVPFDPMMRMLEAQTHRRFLKTHLPVDALVYSPKAKYIYVARDGRDVVWSLYNHFARANDAFYEIINDTPGRVGPPVSRPPADVRRYFLDWLDGDGHPLWSFWENIATWWEIRHLPNLLLLHYADLKRDLEGEMRRVAAFLEVEVDEARWPSMVEHCGFDWMKRNADKAAPLGGVIWEGGTKTFINKGTNGRWRDVLTLADCDRYLRIARERLGDECADWLADGAGRVALAA